MRAPLSVVTIFVAGPLVANGLDVVFARGESPPEVQQFCVGDGTGSFDCDSLSGEPFQALEADTGDLNGDGHLDIVFAAFPPRSCLGNSTGAFSCSVIDPAMIGHGDVALGLVDGDFVLDAVFAVGSAFANRVCIGDGSGGFSCNFLSGEVESNAVALGYLNDDDHLDAVFARSDGFFSRSCLGDGLGGFNCSNIAGTDQDESWDVAIGLFDHSDEIPDLIFANAFEPNRLCFGTAGGSFLCAAINQESRISRGVVLGDFNEDRDLDAVFANDGNTDASEICLGDGAATLLCSDIGGLDPEIGYSEDVITDRLNDDLHFDLIFANDSMSNRVCLGNGRGSFTCSDISGAANRTFGVALGDLVVELIFADGFDSGDTSAWSGSIP